MATDYVVGDDKGWTLDFNYTVWAQDKVFRVGDNLCMFRKTLPTSRNYHYYLHGSFILFY